MAKIKVIAKPIFSFIFTSDQIEGVCFSIGELLTFYLPENITSVSELGSKSWSCGPELQSWRKKKKKTETKNKNINTSMTGKEKIIAIFVLPYTGSYPTFLRTASLPTL